jgi:hypothetical protein
VRRLLFSILLSLPVLAGGEFASLLREIERHDPRALPKSERNETKRLEEEAWRKAKSNYGPHADEYVADYYEKLNLPRRLRLLQDRARKRQKALAGLGEPDHANATEALCDVYSALVSRRREVEDARREVEDEYRSCLVSKPRSARLVYASGTKPKALAALTDRSVLREYAYHLTELQAQCARLLGKKKSESSMLFLARKALLKSREPRLRIEVARVLSGRPETEPTVLLRALAKEKDPGVRAAIASSMARLGDRARDSVELLFKYLDDPSERVRVAMARTLARLHVPEAVEPLVLRLPKEVGRSRVDFSRALESLSGETLGANPEDWGRWWQANRETILNEGLPPPGGKKSDPRAQRWKGEGGFYYGLPQISLRVIYVLDISDSMNYVQEDQRRLDRCKREVKGAIGNLPRTATFAVIAFNDEVRPWKPEMTRATPANKRAAQGFVDELRATQFTNIYDALKEAFRIAGEGPKVRADTIYLLSDGAPTKPDASLDSVETILAAARDWNAMGRLTIHTIGLGKGLKFSFLKRLAAEHGGQFIRREW